MNLDQILQVQVIKKPTNLNLQKTFPFGTKRVKIHHLLCGTVVKGGAYRHKQHLIGGFKDAKNSPEHLKDELKAFMDNKQSLKAQQARFQLHEPDEYDDEEVEIAPPKKPRQKGPMDMYYTPNPYETVKGRNRKGGKQQTINEVCRKDLRDKVCHEIGRWFYEAGIINYY